MTFDAISAILKDSLGLEQSPVAISFHDTAPEGLAHPEAAAPAGCSFWQQGARGAIATDPKDHRFCAVGMYTHNMPLNGEKAELETALKIFADLTYVRPEDLPAVPVLKTEPKFVVYRPLEEAGEADVVLMFVKPNQALILSEAVQQVESGWALALGRPACAVVPYTYNSGKGAISFGCCGARAYMDVFTDDVAICALPGNNLARYAERVQALANANKTLTAFHGVRRGQVEQGGQPTVQDSLTALMQG